LERKMLKHRRMWLILVLGVLCLQASSARGLAQGTSSLALGKGVVANPGQTVALGVVVSYADSLAGLDLLVEFDPDILTFNWFEAQCRLQSVTVATPQPGRLRLTLRRQHPDSTGLPALPPGTDTLGQIGLTATTQDLLTDVYSAVKFVEDGGTPFDDNRLVRTDGSFVVAPELERSDGSVLIRHPLYGDVNDDGFAATVADIIFLANYLGGTQQLTPRQRSNADVNRDGLQAGMADFTELIRMVVEK
jgi:hypothetical protein